MKENIVVGDKFYDSFGEVKVMAIVESKYIVARRKRAMPFILTTNDFISKFKRS